MNSRPVFAAALLCLAACAAAPTEDPGGTGGPGGGTGNPPPGASDAGTPSSDCTPSSGFPLGRGDFAAAVDPVGHRLVVFGGDPSVPVNCAPASAFNGETWLFDLECASWQKITPSPSPRARMASAFDSKRRQLLFFGGRFRQGTSGTYTVYDETWALDLTQSPPKWTRLAVTGDLPSGRSNASAVYDPKGDRFLLFGGNTSNDGLSFSPQNDTYALSLATMTWTRVLINGGKMPAAREYQAAALDAKRNRLVVFSGGDANAFQGPFFGDIWSLDLGTNTWTDVTPGGPQPAHRIRAQLAADPERDRLLLFGGHDDGTGLNDTGERNDLWAFDLAKNAWFALKPGDVLKNSQPLGQCSFAKDFVTPDLDSPERREAHFFGEGGGTFVLFGGKSDCGVLQDVWTFDAKAGKWSEVLPSTTGRSCLRSGAQTCQTLCN